MSDVTGFWGTKNKVYSRQYGYSKRKSRPYNPPRTLRARGVYCYANHSAASVAANMRRHDPAGGACVEVITPRMGHPAPRIDMRRGDFYA